MTWDEYSFTYKPETIEQAFKDGEMIGYNTAISLLMSLEADGLHEMYASGFAEWLVNKREQLLK
jgi:hypothetical protein